jgi:tight adherence protein B
MDPTLVTAIAVFMAVSLGTVSLVLVGEWVRERTRARRVVQELRAFARDSLDVDPEIVKRERGEPSSLELFFARVPQLRDVGHLLERGKTEWSITTFFLLTVGLGIGVGLAAFSLFRFFPAAILASVIAAALPFMYVKRRATLRMRRFEERMPDAIDLIGRAIRAGHPLNAGIKMVADEGPEPINEEFARMFEEQRFGLPFDDTIFGLVDRVPLVDVRIFATAVLIQRQVGGNLAEILDNLAYVIRERFKIRRQLRVITAQGRMSGYVLAVMPVFVGTAIYLLNKSYMILLFTHPIGKLMLVLAIILQMMGYYWIRRIVDIDI